MTHDLAHMIQQSRDRVTGMLRPDKPDIGDVGKAALRAYGSGTPFGAEYEGIQKGNLDRAVTEHKLLTDERSYGLEERKYGLQERQVGVSEARNDLERAKLIEDRLNKAVQQGHQGATLAQNAMKILFEGVTAEDRAAVLLRLVGDDAISPDGLNAMTVTSKVMSDLGIKSKGEKIDTKMPVNFLLPDGGTVLSQDGLTYIDPETGEKRKLPSDAVRLGSETGVDAARAAALMKAARESLGKGQGQAGGGPGPRAGLGAAERAADFGSGPFSNFMAAVDAVFGGLELDAIFGKKGFFPETQDNRQLLRTLKQMGKSALTNSSRGAVWDLQQIDQLFPNPDTFWANPRTEARKIGRIRDALLTEKDFNLRTIASGVLPPKEITRLVTSNIEIDRLITLMGRAGPPAGGDFEGLSDEELLRQLGVGR